MGVKNVRREYRQDDEPQRKTVSLDRTWSNWQTIHMLAIATLSQIERGVLSQNITIWRQQRFRDLASRVFSEDFV